jgi:hypothetical protein
LANHFSKKGEVQRFICYRSRKEALIIKQSLYFKANTFVYSTILRRRWLFSEVQISSER